MFPVQLLTQQTIDGYSPAPADEKCQGHEEKRQAILNSTAFSRTARQEKAVFPVCLQDYDQHEDGQAQRKGSREELYEKGNATKEFGKDSDRADGCRYPILLFLVFEGSIEPTSAEPGEELL